MTYNTFSFDSYHFDIPSKTLVLKYSLDEKLNFEESYKFDFDFTSDIDDDLLDKACLGLFLMAGVSYYKTYLPIKINTNGRVLDRKMASFFSKTYQRGLGEFFYTNNLDPDTPVIFSKDISDIKLRGNHTQPGKLIGIGGGKDSLVTVELLRKTDEDIATWSVGHRDQLKPLVDKIGLKHYYVERTWDRKLLDLNSKGAWNGHIPISAILAFVGVLVAALSGRQDVIVSNEQSANEPTLHYKGVDINHQYSKSQEFEKDFQEYLGHLVGESVRYYSFLRPLSELRIAEVFSKVGFDKYKTVFSSCNKAFIHTSHTMSWCGECPKCAFVFLVLTPFVPREDLEKLWGKNLLLDPSLEPTYKQLLGIAGNKPLDCVGEVKESRSAMKLAQDAYPELKERYVFDLPKNYDYKEIYSHEMPQEVFKILEDYLIG